MIIPPPAAGMFRENSSYPLGCELPLLNICKLPDLSSGAAARRKRGGAEREQEYKKRRNVLKLK